MSCTSAKEDSKRLMDSLLGTAHKMLAKHGEFWPYGGFMELNDQIRHVAVVDETNEYPEAESLIRRLEALLEEKVLARECKATAIVCDVCVTLPHCDQKTDAIQCRLDHLGGYSEIVFFPYQIADGEVRFGETFSDEGAHEFFKNHRAQ